MGHWKTYHPAKKIVMIIGGIIAGIGIVALIGFVIMWLWNGLMPKLFGLTVITYWQGVGLALLGRLLFGGIGGGNGDSGSKHKKRQKMSHCESAYEADWEKYDKWWEAEGKASFEKYDTNEDPDVEVVEVEEK